MMARNVRYVLSSSLVTIAIASCSPQADPPQSPGEPRQPQDASPAASLELGELELVTAQTVFVPAYTEIRKGSQTVGLTTTVAIHNSDPEAAIIIKSVRYFDTAGNLVKEYVDQPMRVGPLGTLTFTAEPTARGGGLGANFIVSWGAETAVHEPVIEAVMIGSAGTSGFSLISPGRVMRETR